MSQFSTEQKSDQAAGTAAKKTAVVLWVIAAVFYFYQYSLKSSPSVMLPQLSQAFGLGALGVASMIGLFYYGYAPFSLVAGLAMDNLGLRRVLPIAAVTVGAGALLFATGNNGLASLGRFMQGAGGVFALVGAIYIATENFPASQAATLTGATQMFGMAGGSAGQFLVGPMISRGFAWNSFWIVMGFLGLVLGVVLFVLLPRGGKPASGAGHLKTALSALWAVGKNPQSILCGLIAGLLFIPTTIFDMIWGVRYLQEGHGMDYATAVLRSSAVPLGWIVGCPLLGFISDKIGRRKPVILGGAAVLLASLAWILFGPKGVLPPFTLGLVTGVVSGAAMLPYTVIKEANPPQYGGSAIGVINFINNSFSALLSVVFGSLLQRVSGGAATVELPHYQSAFSPILAGVAIAIVLTFLLKETGPAARES
jgi:MFS family permease